jgi:hypothetical protein
MANRPYHVIACILIEGALGLALVAMVAVLVRGGLQ